MTHYTSDSAEQPKKRPAVCPTIQVTVPDNS
jgi:hypothetical protein